MDTQDRIKSKMPVPNALARMMRRGRSFSGRERTCCYLNTADENHSRNRFANISASSGLDFPDDGRAIALVDWDQDGDLDIWLANRNAPRIRLMRNDTNSGNDFLALHLEGTGEKTTRDAVGARVQVVTSDAADRPRIKTLRAGEGFLSQSSKSIHFGLGSDQQLQKVIVHWPGGEPEEFLPIQANRRYRLVQGTGTPVEVDISRPEVNLKPSTQQPRKSDGPVRIRLASEILMPQTIFQHWDGRYTNLDVRGQTVLVNLWASWCRPCLAELKEFTEREQDLRAANVEIVALSVDGVGESAGSPSDAQEALQHLGFPFQSGKCTPQFLQISQSVHDIMVPLTLPLPVPTSFLIDSKGKLAVIYKGPVSVDTILADVAAPVSSYEERFRRAALLPGRAIPHPRAEEIAMDNEMHVRLGLAWFLRKSGRLGETAFHYRQILDIDSGFVPAVNNLGKVLLDMRDLDGATNYLERAAQLSPENADVHNNLGLVWYSRQDLTKAAEAFRRAVELDPENAPAWNSLGAVSMSHGELDEAALKIENAIRLDPDYSEAYYNLGLTFVRMGNLAAARINLQRAIDLKPNYPQAQKMLASVQAALDKKTSVGAEKP